MTKDDSMLAIFINAGGIQRVEMIAKTMKETESIRSLYDDIRPEILQIDNHIREVKNE